jgi:SAM-dependent methyltransferase
MKPSSDAAEPAVRELYESREYPPMSHPSADPSLVAVAARLGGLVVRPPWRARILEIGCAGGHHLIPLARRWPGSQCHGVDVSATAVATAVRRAAESGTRNVTFSAVDLRDFVPSDGPFDFVIAHGVLSWVPQAVQDGLLDFCKRHLSADGVAVISYNVLPGWLPRQEVVRQARIFQEKDGLDAIDALERLRPDAGDETPGAAVLRVLIDDMIAKGESILPFDDFAPVNDPWTFRRFVERSAAAGLRYLGESDPVENFPAMPGGREWLAAVAAAGDGLAVQEEIDAHSGRTFRTSVVCRADAPLAEGFSARVVLEWFLRRGSALPPDAPGDALVIDQLLASLPPLALSFRELSANLPEISAPRAARAAMEGIRHGWLRPRVDAVAFDPEPPGVPVLDAFRLRCAHERLPLVDAWLVPCSFPTGHYTILERMDGRIDVGALERLAREQCPELHFRPWLEHLARRGMFG